MGFACLESSQFSLAITSNPAPTMRENFHVRESNATSFRSSLPTVIGAQLLHSHAPRQHAVTVPAPLRRSCARISKWCSEGRPPHSVRRPPSRCAILLSQGGARDSQHRVKNRRAPRWESAAGFGRRSLTGECHDDKNCKNI